MIEGHIQAVLTYQGNNVKKTKSKLKPKDERKLEVAHHLRTETEDNGIKFKHCSCKAEQVSIHNLTFILERG